jgi:glycosyltransferase involved in cell wall biosynthesis
MDDKKLKVSVCVMTYNQKDFIDSCLESLVNQKTNFNYEIIIGDDASTDGTTEVVRCYLERYPDKIKVILQDQNVGSRANYLAIHAAARGEYIAHIDGDDHALPNKLQIQADTLDREPECNVVFHRMKILEEEGQIIRDDMLSLPLICNTRFFLPDLLRFGAIGSHSSKMYRAKYRKLDSLPDPTIDFVVHALHVKDGYIRSLPDFLGVYRRSNGTESTGNDQAKKYLIQLEYLYKLYPECSLEISENALMMMLVHIKNFDALIVQATLIAIKCKSVKPIFRLIRDWRMRRCFRAE